MELGVAGLDTMIHVTTVGPAKDVSAVRCPKSGCLKGTKDGLSFVGLDGKETRIFIDGAADLARLSPESRSPIVASAAIRRAEY